MSIVYNRKTVLAEAKIRRSPLAPLVNAGGCSCAESAYVSNVLKNIGMPYAAGMHAKNNKDWSPKDWDLHAEEEDEKLFPLLKRIADLLSDKERIYLISEVDELIREHDIYVYPYTAKGDLPPEVEIGRHGAKEDLLVKKYANYLIALGAVNKCEVCKNYAWDFSFQKHVFNNGNFHHPGCSLAKAKVAKVGMSADIVKTGDSGSFEFTTSGKIVIGAALSGISFALGAPLALAAVPFGLFTAYAAAPLIFKPDFSKSEPPMVSTLDLALWMQNKNIPADKLNNRGHKFIDPLAIEGGCISATGMSNLMSLPKDGRTRVEFMHRNAQTTKPKVMPAADVLVAAADTFESQAIKGVEKSLKDRQKWWADKIAYYGRSTGNGYVIAFTELYAAFLKWMPASWNAEYKRASSIANDEAEQLKMAMMSTIGFGIPYPLHLLDGNISGLDDLKAKNEVLNANLKKTLVLPNPAKEIIRSWFALLASMVATDTDVQSAVTYVDDSDWGKKNLASDEQVYLVGVVFAKAIGANIVEFTTELWNRSAGWSRFKGLATNSMVKYVMCADGHLAYGGTVKNGGVVYDQRQDSGWQETDRSQYGWATWISDCITNARQLNYLDIILTGYEMISERTGSKSPVGKVKLMPITVA